MFSKRIISMLVVLSFISQALVVVDTDSYSSVVVEDSSILEELLEQNGARTGEPSNLSIPFTSMSSGDGDCDCRGTMMVLGDKFIFGGRSNNLSYDPPSGGDSSGLMTLYITDGTIFGTTSLNKTINPDGDIDKNQFNSYIEHIVMNDVLYFAFDDGKEETGKELWRTDGTEDGTYLVKDIREGSDDSGITDFVVYDNHIYFGANIDGNTNELWKSDGTEEGTVQISDESLDPRYMVVFNDEIYFNGVNDEDGNRHIWKSDGTGEGTVIVSDDVMFEGRAIVFGDHLYFKGYINDNEYGWELYRTDGTDEGTVLFKDVYPGSNTSDLEAIKVAGDYFYFIAQDGTAGQYENLWRSDGTVEGTVKISNLENMLLSGFTMTVFSESQAIVLVDDYWAGDEYGLEPWIFDLTGVEEPRILKDFDPSETDAYSINQFVLGANGVFYFGASNGQFSSDKHLWRSDGTDNGTWMVDYLGDSQTQVSRLTRLGENLIYGAWSSTEQEEGKWRPACGIQCGQGSDLWKLNIGYPSNSAPKPAYTVYTNDEMDPITFDYDESLFQGSIENPTWTTATLGSISYSDVHYVADIDGDGDMDVVSGMNNDNTGWWENDGNSEPSWSANYIPHNLDTGSNNGAHFVHVADMDGDGDLDILASFYYINKVVWFENDGSADPTFTVGGEIETEQGRPQAIFAADMDGDGDMDILLGSVHPSDSGNSDKISWHENDGNVDPTWTASDIDMDEEIQIRDLIAEDMDGDGDMDIVATLTSSNTIAWYENDGSADPTWTAANLATNYTTPMDLFAEDMDGDGDWQAFPAYLRTRRPSLRPRSGHDLRGT